MEEAIENGRKEVKENWQITFNVSKGTRPGIYLPMKWEDGVKFNQLVKAKSRVAIGFLAKSVLCPGKDANGSNRKTLSSHNSSHPRYTPTSSFPNPTRFEQYLRASRAIGRNFWWLYGLPSDKKNAYEAYESILITGLNLH